MQIICTQFYGFKYSYLILITFKQTHRWNPNSNYFYLIIVICLCKFSRSHFLQPAVYTLHVVTPSSSMPPHTQCIWSHFFLVCHQCSLCSISTREHLHPFTLGTKCISSYFWFPVSDFPLACHPRNLYGISRYVFKLISNTGY